MQLRFISTVLLSALITGVAVADPVDYVHPKVDKFSGECVVTSEGVTYHNMQYPSDPPTFYAGYVKFISENEGEPVTINFSEFNCLRGDKPVVFLYDGEEALKSGFTSYSATVPQGYMAVIRPEDTNTDYMAESGVLCVLYAPASKSDFVTSPTGNITGGYTASVTAGTPKDMEFVSAVADNATSAPRRGSRDAVLATLTIRMDGSLNPLTLDALSFDLSKVMASGLVENVRLYDGAVVSDDALLGTVSGVTTSLAVDTRELKTRNVFTIVADVRPDAVGSIPAVNVASLRIGGSDCAVDANALSPLLVENEIWMTNGDANLTYTIVEDTDFYDCGGPEGIIPVKAKGRLTFVPASEGHKVQVDVRSLSLFNTSSTGLNDVFRFYNGREANDDNLIAELLNDTKIIKSTADDGAVTVTFEVKQGNAGKDGWEAVVSQFVPAPMELSGIGCTSAETVSAAAGEQTVPLLFFNVKTTQQLNPLTVSGVSLALAEGADATSIDKIKIYYLGECATFSTSNIYASGGFKSASTFNGEQMLSEGDNWFAVAADIAESALSDAMAGVSLSGVTVNGETVVPDGDASAVITIDNTCRIAEGTHTHRMYDDWAFLSPAPAGSYSSSYPPSMANHTVTFVPTQAGAKAQIEFDSFDVYYASSSYGVKAVFEVYSGESTDANNLIWKLSDSAQASSGPGRKLRSTAANGAITVRFNPNASSSYYCGKGWEASVIQFMDHDAEVKTTEVTQASTAVLVPGAVNAELLSIDVVTEGSLNPLTLSGVNLELRGLPAIKSVNVLTSSSGDFADAVLWGSAAVSADTPGITVLRSDDAVAHPLAEEHNYIFVTVDINDETDSDIAVDARLVSFDFEGGKNIAVENGDPEGERVVKNIYVIEAGDGHVVTVGKPIMFYDEGGPDGPITKGFSGSVTFVPANDDEVLSVNAEEFSIYVGKLYVYSGREADDAAILGKNYYSTVNGPENLLSKADDGSITIKYVGSSYLYGDYDGFAIAVTPVKARPMAVESIVVENASDDDVVRGSSDVAIAHVIVNSDGTSGKLSITNLAADFSSSTNPADITGAAVYYTGTSATFSPTTAITGKVAVPTDGKATFEFSTPVEIDETGSYHFWIGADLSNTASPGNVAAATLSLLTANGVPAPLPQQCTGSRTMVTGMGGTYIVGSSENAKYHSLEAAVRALQLGVEDAVLFMIEDGEYHEDLVIKDVQGTSADHPVVFSSLSGNRDRVVISGLSPVDKQGMVYVENSSYINFRNLTVAPRVNTYFAAIHFKDGSRHCSIENCVVKADPYTSSVSDGIALVRTEAVAEENRNCDYLTIKNSLFEGGYNSMYLSGSGYVALPKDQGLSVTGNTITQSYSKGIYLYDCENFTIADNNISAGESVKKAYNGIDIYRPTGVFRVTGNKIVVSSTSDCTGLYLRQGGGAADAADPAVVANNVIALTNPASYSYGIMLDASMSNLVLAHNSVVTHGDASLKSVFALAFSGNAAATGAPRVCNNVLVNSTASGPLRPWNATHYANMTFSGNVYYGQADVIDTDGKTFAEYQEATGDHTSVWQQPQFFSATDLHLREGDESIKFQRLAEVTVDADGAERPDPATAGAYEYTPVVVETPEIMDGYPAVAVLKDVSATLNTRWTVGGSLYAVVLAADAEAPAPEALKATRPVNIEADTESSYTFNFLEQLTRYKAYFMVVSALGEESSVVVSPEFTTLETIAPLSVEIMWDEEPVETGESILLQAGVTGGKTPYIYEWINQMNEVVGSDDMFMETAVVNSTYRLRVTSSDGQRLSAKAHVPVITANIAMATFDDLPLDAESYWKYDPEADEDTFVDAFFSGSFQFGNFPWVQYDSWSGYGYANETATEFLSYDNQFRNAVGGGAAGTANYGVAYMYGADTSINISAPEGGFTVPGVYVTNAAVTLNSILNGDGWCEKFTAANSDFMTLVITGLMADGTESSVVEVTMADFRDNTPEILTEWKWVDLSSLGSVSGLKFGYESSQKAQVPGYVCFDQLGAANPLSGIGSIGDNEIAIAFPTDDCLSVLGIDGGYTLRVYTVDGVLRASHHLWGASTVSTATLPAGTCLAEILSDEGTRTVLRFQKK